MPKGGLKSVCTNHPGRQAYGFNLCRTCYDRKRSEDPEIRARCSVSARKTQLKKYGLTQSQYNDLLARQGGHCAICVVAECPTGRSFAVDHDHSTGKVRGLLCSNCNQAIGKLKDSPIMAEKLIDYLNRTNNSWLSRQYKPIMLWFMVVEIALLCVIVWQGFR